jgi:hypothetical protein
VGNPLAVRVGPGILKIAPLGTAEPADLVTAWNVAWVDLGYTNEGSNFVFETTFENIAVAEEYDPVAILQTARSIMVNFALAEITADNMKRAFNGGTVTIAGVIVTFDPPPAGTFTYVMLGWQADDNMERWVFRKCLQVGALDIPRKKAPDKAVIPVSFRAVKPASLQPFKFIHDTDYT